MARSLRLRSETVNRERNYTRKAHSHRRRHPQARQKKAAGRFRPAAFAEGLFRRD